MPEMVSSSELSRLRKSRVIAWWARNPKSSCRQGFRHGLESHYGQSVCQPDQAGHRATQGVAGHPNIRVRVDLGDVRIKIQGLLVVVVFVIHRFDDASQICSICFGLAVARLPP